MSVDGDAIQISPGSGKMAELTKQKSNHLVIRGKCAKGEGEDPSL